MRRDLLDRARGRGSEPVECIGDVLRDALQRGGEAGAQPEQLLDLLLQLADLAQAFGAKRSGALLCVADDRLRARRRLTLELVAAAAHLVERARHFVLVLAGGLDAPVELG